MGASRQALSLSLSLSLSLLMGVKHVALAVMRVFHVQASETARAADARSRRVDPMDSLSGTQLYSRVLFIGGACDSDAS